MADDDELKVKFIIDKEGFTDELNRMRQELGEMDRIGPGDYGAGGGERVREVVIRETTDGGIDPSILGRIEGLERDQDDLKRAQGLPTILERMTPEELKDQLAEAIKQPGWENVTEEIKADLTRLMEGLVSRHPEDPSFGDLWEGGEWKSSVSAARIIRDLVGYTGGVEEGREIHPGTETERAINAFGMGRTGTRDVEGSQQFSSAAHAGLESAIAGILRDVYGKITTVEERIPYGPGKGDYRIMDVVGRFEAGLVTSEGDVAVDDDNEIIRGIGLVFDEIAASRIGADKKRQIVSQTIGIIREIGIDELRAHPYVIVNDIIHPRIKALTTYFSTSGKDEDLSDSIISQLVGSQLIGDDETAELRAELFQPHGELPAPVHVEGFRLSKEFQFLLGETWEPGRQFDTKEVDMIKTELMGVAKWAAGHNPYLKERADLVEERIVQFADALIGEGVTREEVGERMEGFAEEIVGLVPGPELGYGATRGFERLGVSPDTPIRARVGPRGRKKSPSSAMIRKRVKDAFTKNLGEHIVREVSAREAADLPTPDTTPPDTRATTALPGEEPEGEDEGIGDEEEDEEDIREILSSGGFGATGTIPDPEQERRGIIRLAKHLKMDPNTLLKERKITAGIPFVTRNILADVLRDSNKKREFMRLWREKIGIEEDQERKEAALEIRRAGGPMDEATLARIATGGVGSDDLTELRRVIEAMGTWGRSDIARNILDGIAGQEARSNLAMLDNFEAMGLRKAPATMVSTWKFV